ncbi:AraC family transcriptional regulator [Geodermatophilus sp. URMC 64]
MAAAPGWGRSVPTGRRVAGAPVFGYPRVPGTPPIAVARLSADDHPEGAPRFQAHAHDFVVVAYFDRGGGTLRVDDRAWTVRAGDVFVIAPHEVVGPEWTGDVAGASAWTVFFPVDAVDARAGAGISWRAHPLLFPFVGTGAGGPQRLHVPEVDRPTWTRRFAELAEELAGARDGYAEAAQALLTLLLVDLARLAADVSRHLRLADEPLLAAVFDVIERRFAEPISLRDVADAVGLTPGHLTTVVRRRTGRTVQQWLTERRMAEARRLLADPRLTVAAVATRVGYADPGYFIRRFRTAHGVPPAAWRRVEKGAIPLSTWG